MGTVRKHLRRQRHEREPEVVASDYVPETERASNRRYWQDWLRKDEDPWDSPMTKRQDEPNA